MTAATRKRSVWLVQQGVWDMAKESMPLAVGYLKAAALADDRIREELELRICNFGGGDSAAAMAEAMFRRGSPDIMAFSVFGWNYRAFGSLAETFKQVNPDGWVVFGGTHVANQAQRVFRQFPEVDVLVNTEGEFVFRELLREYLDGRSRHDLGGIDGISFRAEDGQPTTTADRPRIQDLDSIPSPILSGAIPLTDAKGAFRYDVAIMETNRGCPYKCAFCYWGGAIGQKVRAFSRDRLHEELELLAHHGVQTIALCDANFGMLKQDLDFIEDAIRIRERTGYPRAVESSWAKNKSKLFYEIVRAMKRAGMQGSFTLALQTLDETTLEMMQRKNMRLNDWEDLVHWLYEEGMDCYVELIWGAPGETPQTFLEGYDRLARYVHRIAAYPLLLLPNTEYSNSRDRFGLVTVRGDHDDFEYVLAHNTMTIVENDEMQRFLFWARSLAENMVFRHIWSPLRELAGITQSTVIKSCKEWFAASEHPSAVRLSAIHGRLGKPSAIPAFLRHLYRDPEIDDLFHGWWRDMIEPMLPDGLAGVMAEVLRYDCLTRPVYDEPGVDLARWPGLHVAEVDGERLYCRSGVRFEHDVPGLIAQLRRGEAPQLDPRPVELDLYFRTGFYQYIDNHEEATYFDGKTLESLRRPGEDARGLAPGHRSNIAPGDVDPTDLAGG